jgi:hypothetical protein
MEKDEEIPNMIGIQLGKRYQSAASRTAKRLLIAA